MSRRRIAALVVAAATVTAAVHAASVSRQQADQFARKLATVVDHGDAPAPAARRTPFTEGEVNSWFTYHAGPLLPEGLSRPSLTIVGNGRLIGGATVDLDAIGRRQSSGGRLDPWSLLGGRMPLTVSGILHTRDGRGRFEVESAEVSGIPVPTALLQELLSYYSRSPERPDGVRLDDVFTLPASIQRIEVGPGRAVVVQ